MKAMEFEVKLYDIRDSYGARYILNPTGLHTTEGKEIYELWRVWLNSAEVYTVGTRADCEQKIKENEGV